MATIPEGKVRIDAYIPEEVNNALRAYMKAVSGIPTKAGYRGLLSLIVTLALAEFLERRGFKVESQPRMEIKNVVGER